MILNVKNRFMILILKIKMKRKKEIRSLMTRNRKPKMTRSSKLFSHQWLDVQHSRASRWNLQCLSRARNRSRWYLPQIFYTEWIIKCILKILIATQFLNMLWESSIKRHLMQKDLSMNQSHHPRKISWSTFKDTARLCHHWSLVYQTCIIRQGRCPITILRLRLSRPTTLLTTGIKFISRTSRVHRHQTCLMIINFQDLIILKFN
jgi:hypothetical protein